MRMVHCQGRWNLVRDALKWLLEGTSRMVCQIDSSWGSGGGTFTPWSFIWRAIIFGKAHLMFPRKIANSGVEALLFDCSTKKFPIILEYVLTSSRYPATIYAQAGYRFGLAHQAPFHQLSYKMRIRLFTTVVSHIA